MSGDLHGTTLHRSDLVVIEDVRCRAARGAGPDEGAAADDIVFPRRGAFVRRARSGIVCGDASAILFFNRDEPYQVSHPLDGGDDCTVLSFVPALLAEALTPVRANARGHGGGTFPRPEAPADPGTFARLQRLRARLAQGSADALEADESALELLEHAVAALARRDGRPAARRRPTTARAHRETVFAARALMARDLAEPLSLARIAKAVYSSPFHLARVFARESGETIHRHLIRLRLRAALERLAAGEQHLAALALDVGFGSHSHFTDAFRREFGVPPSTFRTGLSARRLRETSRILEAEPPHTR